MATFLATVGGNWATFLFYHLVTLPPSNLEKAFFLHRLVREPMAQRKHTVSDLYFSICPPVLRICIFLNFLRLLSCFLRFAFLTRCYSSLSLSLASSGLLQATVSDLNSPPCFPETKDLYVKHWGADKANWPF